jgi:hypothetical protein
LNAEEMVPGRVCIGELSMSSNIGLERSEFLALQYADHIAMAILDGFPFDVFRVAAAIDGDRCRVLFVGRVLQEFAGGPEQRVLGLRISFQASVADGGNGSITATYVTDTHECLDVIVLYQRNGKIRYMDPDAPWRALESLLS